MEVNKSIIKDWLSNGWEHDFLEENALSFSQRIDLATDYLMENQPNQSKKLKSQINELVTHWSNNEENERVKISMDLKNEDELLESYIKKFIK